MFKNSEQRGFSIVSESKNYQLQNAFCVRTVFTWVAENLGCRLNEGMGVNILKTRELAGVNYETKILFNVSFRGGHYFFREILIE